MEIKEYLATNGRSPFRKWFNGLNAVAAAKVTVAVTRMAKGNLSNVESVGQGVLEFKISFGPGYRIYFGKDSEELIILLAGGTKKKQSEDIAAAQAFWGQTIKGARRRRANMALTRDFKETVQARVQRDPKFRENLITEAAGCLLAGDVETGKTILRDYINATVGFEKLGAAVHKSPKSLMRMFGEKGNPQAQNLFSVFAYIQKKEKIKLAVHPEPA